MSKDVTNKDEAKPLTAGEAKQFERLQKVVFEGLRDFIRVGNALAEIRERKLYRKVTPTFEGYCKIVFDLSESRVYQLMDAYQVTENLHSCGGFEDDDGEVIDLKPINEAQCRPLAGLLPEQQRQVWGHVVESVAPGAKVTASLVAKVTKKFKGQDVKERVRNARNIVPADILVSAPFHEAFDTFHDALTVEVEAGFKGTDREVIVHHLDQLRQALSEDGNLLEDPAFYDGHDANKLEKAGYTILRMEKTSKTIKVRSGGGWPKYEGPFKTIKAMETAFSKLLKDSLFLRG